MKKYFTDIFSGIWNLLKGMKITGKVLVSPAVTECYPEKRDELQPKERFRAELTMPHNENNEHKCTACGICAMNCPNQTITVKKSKITDENGKPKIVLDQYLYDIGSCIFCGLCTRVCPQLRARSLHPQQADQAIEQAGQQKGGGCKTGSACGKTCTSRTERSGYA